MKTSDGLLTLGMALFTMVVLAGDSFAQTAREASVAQATGNVPTTEEFNALRHELVAELNAITTSREHIQDLLQQVHSANEEEHALEERRRNLGPPPMTLQEVDEEIGRWNKEIPALQLELDKERKKKAPNVQTITGLQSGIDTYGRYVSNAQILKGRIERAQKEYEESIKRTDNRLAELSKQASDSSDQIATRE
jgi:predicted  nucleic acid-binding Zn-ribbon protein